jgi:hypothetical protein
VLPAVVVEVVYEVAVLVPIVDDSIEVVEVTVSADWELLVSCERLEMLVLVVNVLVHMFVVVPATEPATVLVVQLVAVTEIGLNVVTVFEVSELVIVDVLDDCTEVLLEVESMTVVLCVDVVVTR